MSVLGKNVLKAAWPAPSNVRTAITTRDGGFSESPYNHLNLALHVGDDASAVSSNRQTLCDATDISQWAWLTQVHSTRVVDARVDKVQEADGSYTQVQGLACAVLTADCLPVLLCDSQGTQVAAVHAGWRGLAQGILARALEHFSAPAHQLMAYIGPAISQAYYEVDTPVIEAFDDFLKNNKQARIKAAQIFSHNVDKPGHFFLNLAEAAKIQLLGLGVGGVYGGDLCTYRDKRFYSYRREGRTGRFATAIWLE